MLFGELGSPSLGVLPFLTAIGAAALGYFAARRTAIAPLQASLNDAFRSAMASWQTERAQLIARVSELEGEVLRQRGEINNHLQIIQSQQRRIERAGGD